MELTTLGNPKKSATISVLTTPRAPNSGSSNLDHFYIVRKHLQIKNTDRSYLTKVELIKSNFLLLYRDTFCKTISHTFYLWHSLGQIQVQVLDRQINLAEYSTCEALSKKSICTSLYEFQGICFPSFAIRNSRKFF